MSGDKEQVKILSAEDILNANDLKAEVVEVPEWGGSVRIRTMTGLERDEFEAQIARQSTGEGANVKVDMRGLKVKVLSLTVVDDQGKLLFTPKQIQQLEKKSGKALDDVFQVASKLNGLGEKQLEELAKNSGGGQSAAIGSSSPDK